MEFKEILRRRRSVRKYLSRPVEREVLDTVLREALAAPSSRNSHSTHLRVLTDPETIARIARMRDYGSAFLEHAPAVVLVEGDRTATDLWRELLSSPFLQSSQLTCQPSCGRKISV